MLSSKDDIASKTFVYVLTFKIKPLVNFIQANVKRYTLSKKDARRTFDNTKNRTVKKTHCTRFDEVFRTCQDKIM